MIADSGFMQVESRRVDEIFHIVSELALETKKLESTDENYTIIKNRIEILFREVLELKHESIKEKKISFSNMANKLYDVMEQYEKEYNKQIVFMICNEKAEIEFSKIGCIEKVLCDILRYCMIDMESNIERSESGKNEKGAIGLKIFNYENQTKFEICSDGHGLYKDWYFERIKKDLEECNGHIEIHNTEKELFKVIITI